MSNGRYATRSRPTQRASQDTPGDALSTGSDPHSDAWNPHSQEVILIEDSPVATTATETTASSSVTSGPAYSHATGSRPGTNGLAGSEQQNRLPSHGYTDYALATQAAIQAHRGEDDVAHYYTRAAAQASKRMRSSLDLSAGSGDFQTGAYASPALWAYPSQSDASHAPLQDARRSYPLPPPTTPGEVQQQAEWHKYRDWYMAKLQQDQLNRALPPAQAQPQRLAAHYSPSAATRSPASPAVGSPYYQTQQALTANSAGKRKREDLFTVQQQQLQQAVQLQRRAQQEEQQMQQQRNQQQQRQQQQLLQHQAQQQQILQQQMQQQATARPAQAQPVRKPYVAYRSTGISIPNKAREVHLRKEYSAQFESRGSTEFDDAEGHYIIVPRAPLTSRYRVVCLLGQGTFGKVVRAWDQIKRIFVAIKIIRAVQKYRDASMIELRVLRTLYERDPENLNNCIHLRDCFDYRNHVCIVTDLLRESIFDFLKGNDFASFPRRHIQSFAKQLFNSVGFLHENNLIHTDLKPENILLVKNEFHLEPWRGRTAQQTTRKVLESSDIRLIDFGSATFEDEYHSTVVSTRHYRAPEIILGMGWSFPCDIWSIGCILLELFTGDALFQTHDNLEHLAMMEIVCGPLDGRIVRQSSKLAQKMFKANGRLDYPNKETTKDSRKFVKQMKPFHEMLPRRQSVFCEQFGKLLEEIFVYDPLKRITAKKALSHRFFQIDADT